jgi:hypothetical protein
VGRKEQLRQSKQEEETVCHLNWTDRNQEEW